MKNVINNRKIQIAVLFVLTFLVFGRAINYDFVWDDERSHLTAHEDLMKGNVGRMWAHTYDGMYIPVTYTTWNVVKSFAKDGDHLNPKPFHFVNILTHAVNVILLFLILQLLFGNALAAFLGAMVFGFHPLQVESVAWISEFRGLLSAMFSFLAMLVLFRNLKKKTFAATGDLIASRFFILASLLFVCALLSKPTAVMLPFIVLLLVWFFFRESFKAMRSAIIIWICIVIPVALATGNSQQNEIVKYVTPIAQRIPLTGYSIGFYLQKFIFPFGFAPSYGLTPQLILQGALPYVYTAVVFGFGIFLYLRRKRLMMVFAGYSIFIISVLPVTGIITFYFQRYSNVADRYAYFGLMGFALMAAYLCTLPPKKIIAAIVSVFIGVGVVLSFLQVPVWQNEFSIWNESMKKYPDQFQAAYNLGVYYGKQNKPLDALINYNVAIHFNPTDKNTVVNRANTLAQLGRYEEAISGYDDAIQLDPNDASIYYNRALTNYNMGHYNDCPPDILKAQELGMVIDMQFATAVRDAMHANKK